MYIRLFDEHSGLMLNSAVIEGQRDISYCINKVNNGVARAVPKAIVYEIVVTTGSVPRVLGLQMWGQSAVALTELGGDKHLFTTYLRNLLLRWLSSSDGLP